MAPLTVMVRDLDFGVPLDFVLGDALGVSLGCALGVALRGVSTTPAGAAAEALWPCALARRLSARMTPVHTVITAVTRRRLGVTM
jgi:hypothetical protein